MNLKKIKLFFLIACSCTAWAQNKKAINLDEIIISENRLELPFNQTARNIQVLTAKQIQQLPVRSVNEVLSLMAGVDVRQRSPFGSQADISIDGGTSEQTLVLLNGIKVSDVQTAHHSLNIPVPLDAIERIEVLKGPAARIYGINSLTGVVNIVTKKVKETQLTVNAYSGSSFKNKEPGDGKGQYWGGGAQLVGALARKKSAHLVALNNDRYNGQRYNSAANILRAFYQGTYNLGTNYSADVFVGQIFNDFGANGFYAAPGDKEARELVNTNISSLGMNFKITDNFTIKPRIANRYNEDDYRYFRNNLARARSKHYTHVFNTEIHANYITQMGTFGLGWESRWEQIHSSNIGEHERTNHGFYAEYKTLLIQKIGINVGGYTNYNSDYGWQFFPGLDAAYQFLPDFKFGINIGSSQRIPSFTDLYLNQRPGNIGNPNLKAENAWQYEANIKYTKNNWTAQMGYFYRNISNFIDWVRTDNTQAYQPFNEPTNKIQGLNVQVKNTFTLHEKSKFHAAVSYNYLNPKKIKYPTQIASKYVIENLKHQAIANLGYIYSNWYLQAIHKYLQRELKNGYHVTDVRLGYRFKNAEIYADATNIFDSKYSEIAAVPMPSRWFVLGLKYKFK